jgi:V/A-type H+-transporting ATPase subunit D
MAKIKHTKNEQKAQNDSLSRYQRFLPMLLLKKQQLQAEIQTVDTQLKEKQQLFSATMDGLKTWSALFSEPIALDELVSLDDIQTDTGNIAGVSIPILKSVLINRSSLDLFETPTWLDDAQDALSTLIEMRTAIEVLEQQRVLIAEELRTTAQRVNLFEKIKIPECKEHIRIIKIFLGDEQTAAVARGKLAKKRSEKVQS